MTNQVFKSQGQTPSEQYLAKLCQKSFLSLWSYPNLFNDKGRSGGKGMGQELCDLLVVFDKHVIIFSDKSCNFPAGNIDLAWKRWYKSSIEKSAEQVFGAERWIKKFPDRIYLDSLCTTKLPLPLPNANEIKIHRVIIALNAGGPVRKYFNSKSGSLVLKPYLVKDEPINKDFPGYIPFCTGQINPEKGYVHIFDDESLDIVLNELDTISDFVTYLEKKEKFILSGKFAYAAGEEDVLAFYLRNLEDKEAREFDFPMTDEPKTFYAIDEGMWEKLKSHPQYVARNEINKVSYIWDDLIEFFNKHFLEQTLIMEGKGAEQYYIKAVQRMASESRFYRRYLAQSLVEFLKKYPEGYKAVRTV